MRPEPERLRDIPLFSALTDDERTSVAAHLELRDVSPGQHLTNQGSSGYFFFVIEEGSAEVTRDGAQVATLAPGDFFGEAAILSAATRRNATVTAQTPMRVIAMFGADFAKLMADSPALAARIREVMEARLSS